MAATVCPVCGKKQKCKIKVADGRICYDCLTLSPNFGAETVDKLKTYHKEQTQRRAVFSKTRVIKSLLSDLIIVDENNRMFYIGKEKDELPTVYLFDEVLSVNFESQTHTVTKKKGGVGRAIVGGALFGGVGAVVGAATAKDVTTQQTGPKHLVLSLNAYFGKATITLYSPPIGADQFFNTCINNKTCATSSIEDIIKYKKLLDEGIITQAEYDTKKKELLNL